ncbi:MAG: AraC family transcriptional regulator, partial [Rhodospirillaceae bacterium]
KGRYRTVFSFAAEPLSGRRNLLIPRSSCVYVGAMDKVASGKIAFWEGGSLWVLDVPTGEATPDRIAMHSHHAFQLTFSLGGDFGLHLEDQFVGGPFAVVAPDTPHAFEAQGLISLLFIEPESRAGRALAELMRGEPASQLSTEKVRDAPALFKTAFEHPRNPVEALTAAGKEVAARIAAHVRTTEPDRRVRQIIKWASENLDGAVTMSDAARAVGLSRSRASHLFVEETGLPFRTYVLWLRLVRAVDAHIRGANLTDAAQQAGFSDSAHFSRTFRRMFGLPAAALKMS